MKYRAVILTLSGLFIAILLSRQAGFHSTIISFADFSYVGAVAMGMFFVSTFTVATSFLGLLYLAQAQNILTVAIAAGVGAVLGDLLIFRFVRDSLVDELGSLLDKIPYFRKRHLSHLAKNRRLAWFLPVAGAIVIASPFPDEIGVSLMGISKVKPWRFILISFLLNSIGIYILLVLARAIDA